MLRLSKSIFSRLFAGLFVFAGAGLLAQAILTDNGGGRVDQAFWKQAQKKTIVLSDDAQQSSPAERSKALERILTGSIKPLSITDEGLPQAVPEPERELSVLSLIRENSDIAPAVSSGTDRVSVTVKPGDTLYAIAKRHGLQLAEIARLNGLEKPYVIKSGQVIYVAR